MDLALTAIVISAILAVFFAVLYALFRFVFYTPDRTQNDDFRIPHSAQTDPLRETIIGMIRALNAVPFERVYVTSYDGLRLAGRYYAGRAGAPVVLLFHGYRGTPSRDFSGGAQFYREQGFHVLSVEQRGHCSSEGHVITFGVRERRDCLTWIDYARSRFGAAPTVLCGISMGAATVLMAAGMDLPDNVRGVIADAPYTSPKAILCRVLRDRHYPARIVYPLLALGARLFGGFRPTDADALEAVRRTRVPILLIHGEDDRFVPCEMGRAIASANPRMVELQTFPGAGHGLSFLVDRPRYERAAASFLARVL